jgi:NTF2 fold immunity protein
MLLTPEATAKQFFTSMVDWEIWSAEIDQSPPSNDAEYEARTRLRIEKLRGIFEMHLSSKALAHNQSRYDLANYSKPPEYDAQITKTEEVSGTKWFVYVKGTGWMPEERYVFLKENNQWRADHREYLNHAGKWVKEREL